jgi:polycystin 1
MVGCMCSSCFGSLWELSLVSLCDAFCVSVTRLRPGTGNNVYVAYSLVCWPSSEGTLSWPDLLSDPSVVSSTLQRLTQGRPGCMLGSEEDGASLVSPSLPAKYLSASGEPEVGRNGFRALGEFKVPSVMPLQHALFSLDEDLIHQVLADGANNLVPTQDTLLETDLLTSL